MDKTLHKELMTLSGHTYHNRKFDLPNGWKELTSLNSGNGFQTTIYQKENEIVISYRGTDTPRDWNDDIQMWKTQIPDQYQQANGVYKEIKKIFPNANITVTGHSLGGSLAQLVSAKNGCRAVTFNAYGTGEILNNNDYYNVKNLNIINYGNPYDPVFAEKYNAQPGRTFLTGTDFNSAVYWDEQNKRLTRMDRKKHFLENMGTLEDAVEVEPLPERYQYDVPNMHHASAEKTDFIPFSINQIAQMSDEDFIKNEPQIMQQLRNRQFKEQKTDFSKYANPLTGSKKIYTKEELEKMTPEEFMKNENEIMGQLQAIGLPAKNDLPQKHFSTNSSDGKWVTINGNHVFIEK